MWTICLIFPCWNPGRALAALATNSRQLSGHHSEESAAAATAEDAANGAIRSASQKCFTFSQEMKHDFIK